MCVNVTEREGERERDQVEEGRDGTAFEQNVTNPVCRGSPATFFLCVKVSLFTSVGMEMTPNALYKHTLVILT